MRGGKMIESMRETLKHLLNELKSPRNAIQVCNFYKVGYWFRNENEANNFRKLLLFNIGFNGIRVESHTTYHRTPGYLIYVTWHESEQKDLIKNIERYLQEDNMGPTNINRENTKFYAIITDAEGKKTAYAITHSSLESDLKWSCSGSDVHHTLRFEQEDMRECECIFTEYVELSDEVDKLRAENEKLKTRLGNCEDQLRSACEFLNGYGDVHIDIPTELKNLDYFSRIVNYTNNGENNRREFGKKVAEQVKRLAGANGMWKRIATDARQEIKSKQILDDAVETTINPFYVTRDTVKADRIDALSYSALLCRSLRLKFNSVYGITAVRLEGDIPEINIYDHIKDVKFANPATIVFWTDGTKTVVKAQGDEQYVPEVGLAMCICKKVMGNTRDYYRVFKHWMKKV